MENSFTKFLQPFQANISQEMAIIDLYKRECSKHAGEFTTTLSLTMQTDSNRYTQIEGRIHTGTVMIIASHRNRWKAENK